MKFYQTNETFNKEKFVGMLNENGIEAEVAENGIYFDEEALKVAEWHKLPHWIYMNRDLMLRG